MKINLVLVLMLLLPRVSRGQEGSDLVLAGVDSVDAHLELTWDARIRDLNEQTIRSRLQTVFELELRQRGVVVSKGASNYLTISFAVLPNDVGGVSYSWDVSLSEPGWPKRVINDMIVNSLVNLDYKRPPAVNRAAADSERAALLEVWGRGWDRFYQAYDTSKAAWVTTWEGPGGVAYVGRLNLRDALERRTTELAQAFVNAYIAVHPRR